MGRYLHVNRKVLHEPKGDLYAQGNVLKIEEESEALLIKSLIDDMERGSFTEDYQELLIDKDNPEFYKKRKLYPHISLLKLPESYTSKDTPPYTVEIKDIEGNLALTLHIKGGEYEVNGDVSNWTKSRMIIFIISDNQRINKGYWTYPLYEGWNCCVS